MLNDRTPAPCAAKTIRSMAAGTAVVLRDREHGIEEQEPPELRQSIVHRSSESGF